MPASNETLYMKAEQSAEVNKLDVTLGDIAKLECADTAITNRLKTIKVLKIPLEGQHRYVISVLKLIQLIHQIYPSLEIQNLGAPDIIVIYEDGKTPAKFVHVLKTIGICFITFIGAAFSIMAFNNDVSSTELFSQIYEQLTGVQSDGFTILELTYSIGLIVGIIIFFNHFGGKRFSVDPTPMEVEMRLYENDLQTALIQNYSREGEELDVNQTDTSRNRRV